MLRDWHLQGRAVFLGNFRSILIQPTFSLAQNPRADQAEGTNSLGSPIYLSQLPISSLSSKFRWLYYCFLVFGSILGNPRILNLGICQGCNNFGLFYLRGFNSYMIVLRMFYAMSRLVLQPCWFMIDRYGDENLSRLMNMCSKFHWISSNGKFIVSEVSFYQSWTRTFGNLQEKQLQLACVSGHCSWYSYSTLLV